jgi:hypothetical protein
LRNVFIEIQYKLNSNLSRDQTVASVASGCLENGIIQGGEVQATRVCYTISTI